MGPINNELTAIEVEKWGMKPLRKGRMLGARKNTSKMISAVLKGISQVILIENAVTGCIFLAAIAIADYKLGIVTLVSAIIGNVIGHVCGASEEAVNRGLFGYNSVLTGLALFLSFRGDEQWAISLVGAALATLVTAALMHTFRNSELPILTIPYIGLTWCLLLSLQYFSAFEFIPDLSINESAKLNWEGGVHGISGMINGIGQVFFLHHFWSATLVLIGVICSSWKLGVYAVIGTAAAWLTGFGLGAEMKLLNMGLYGYNAVLTMIAVSAIFDVRNRTAPFTGILASIITVPVTAGITSWLMPYGLPALTMPFVVVTWLFVSARKILPKI